MAVVGGPGGGLAGARYRLASSGPRRLRSAHGLGRRSSTPRGDRAGGGFMMAGIRRGRLVWAWVVAVLLVSGVTSLEAAVKPRAIIIVPFDASTLPSDDQWIGEGIAQVLSLGLVQHPGFVEIERARLRAGGRPDVWGEPAVTQAARSLKVDAALYGQVIRTGGELVTDQ